MNIVLDVYALPFEIVSMLLLAALIGCIVIAMKEKQIPTPEQVIPDEIKKETE